MAGRFWGMSVLMAMAATPLSAQVKAPPIVPVAPPPLPMRDVASSYQYGELLVTASDSIAKGEWDKAIRALDEKSRSLSFTGPDAQLQHVVMGDLVTLLTYSDPNAAEVRYKAWLEAAPSPSTRTPLDLMRLPISTRLKIALGRTAEAEAALAAEIQIRDNLNAAQNAKIAAEIKAKTRNKRGYYPEDAAFDGVIERYSRAIRLSEFLLRTHERGEAAFPDFTPRNLNPFFSNESTLNLHSTFMVSCASSGLTPQDWMVAQVGFDRNRRAMIATPFALSRPDVIQPMFEALDNVNISIKGMQTIAERQYLLLRCTRAVPPAPASEVMPDYTYLREMLLPLIPDKDAESKFNIFTDPISDLVKQKSWVVLLNYAYAPYTAAPESFALAQRTLLAELEAMPKPDPVAIAIVKLWMLPDESPGQTTRKRSLIPLYTEAVNQLKDVPGMPPRVRAYQDYKLAFMHEGVGDAAAAEAIYRAIIARAPKELDEKSSEVMRARLRLAAITEASGRYTESAAIFDTLGLSPEQCSLYQSRPAMTSFQMPDYPMDALRFEVEGNVQFEFDLDTAGKPTNFRVLASTPPFVFDAKTTRSFSTAAFAPATRGGKALPCEAALQGFTWRIPD